MVEPLRGSDLRGIPPRIPSVVIHIQPLRGFKKLYMLKPLYFIKHMAFSC